MVGEATGTTAAAAQYLVTVWPWIAVAVSLALAASGLAVLVLGRHWAGTSRRYDSAVPADAASNTQAGDTDAATARERAEDLDEIDAWDQLSRGHDPT